MFPDELKTAKVSPIFKAGETIDVSNYRPISVLPCFSKILERIMDNRLCSYNFLQSNKILYNKQFGFQKLNSTNHAIIELAIKCVIHLMKIISQRKNSSGKSDEILSR